MTRALDAVSVCIFLFHVFMICIPVWSNGKRGPKQLACIGSWSYVHSWGLDYGFGSHCDHDDLFKISGTPIRYHFECPSALETK